MKQLEAEYFTFTEIGGVGEMIYKEVRFPEYVSEYDYAEKEDVIVPLFTALVRPTSGTDYSITGQELLASLCNLYKRINAPESTERISDLVWEWCRNHIYPYDIEELCNIIETGNFMDVDFLHRLEQYATFAVKDFIGDLCKLGTAFEYYDALQKVRCGHDVTAGRNLYHEGRVCDNLSFLEKYAQFTDDASNSATHNKILLVSQVCGNRHKFK